GERVRAAGIFEGAAALRDHRGRALTQSSVGERQGPELIMLHRSDLLRILHDAVPPGDLRPGVTVESVDADGLVRHSAGEERVDLVVGADGVRSTVRPAVDPHAAGPRYTGWTVWRLVLERPADVPREGHETWARGGLFGMAPMGGDRLYCYAVAFEPEGGGRPGQELADVRLATAGWPEPVPRVLAAARPDQVIRNDLYDLPPLRSYVRGRLALLGDAAHAMTPNLGQGANQALEDAVTLAALVPDGSNDPDGSDVPAALREYDRLRRPRTQRIAARSRAAGRLAMAQRQPFTTLRNLLARATPASVMVRSLAKIADWQPPA
ncbi:MAG: FAD-dependent monooxygenase, partial [Thermocrispum sp.]